MTVSKAIQGAKYGSLTIWNRIQLVGVVARILAAVSYSSALNILLFRSPRQKRRTTGLAVTQTLTKYCSYAQIQYVQPPSIDGYKAWTRKANLPVVIESLVDDTNILWMGPKRRDKVVLYIHGGGYYAPVADYSLSYWRYVQQALKKNDVDVGFAVLAYGLIPEVGFKTALRQAMLAVEHIIASGVEPHDLQIVGDSAGANLIMALVSHILHPIESIRPMIGLKEPIGGAYLLSPWVCLKGSSPSMQSNGGKDLGDAATMHGYADAVLEHANLKDDELPYIEPLNAPQEWFDDLSTVLSRLFVSTGESEIFRDDIKAFVEKLAKFKPDITFTIQEGGIHDDPMVDFAWGNTDTNDLSSLTPEIISWLAQGYVS